MADPRGCWSAPEITSAKLAVDFGIAAGDLGKSDLRREHARCRPWLALLLPSVTHVVSKHRAGTPRLLASSPTPDKLDKKAPYLRPTEFTDKRNEACYHHRDSGTRCCRRPCIFGKTRAEHN